MATRIRVLLLLVVLALSYLLPGIPVLAAQPEVLESRASASFPSSIDFRLSAHSDQNIVDVRLYYDVERESFARVVNEIYIKLSQPAPSVEAGWSWDLRSSGGMPPGTGINYWWRIIDAGGGVLETAPQRLVFADTNHSWQEITDGQVTLLWYSGDDAFARELMAAAQTALGQLYDDTGARLKEPVEIYIYADSRELQEALLFAQQWTGGQAFPRYNKIAIGIATYMLDWGKRAVVHELTHLVTHQMTFNPYGDLPTWLNEGLSMYAEGDLEAAFKNYFNKALAEDSLLSVRSLASPFSAFSETSYLSYAESYKIVEYLIREYGRDKMLNMLDTFKAGSTADGALFSVYGLDMDILNELWRDYVMAPVPSDSLGEVEINPGLIGLLVLVVAALITSGVWLWRVRR